MLKNAEKPLNNPGALKFQLQKRINEKNQHEATVMFREKLFEKLKLAKIGNEQDEEKIGKPKRLSSSEEFQKGYDAIWREGPKVSYNNTNDWRRMGDKM